MKGLCRKSPTNLHEWVCSAPEDDDPWCKHCGILLRHDEYADAESLDAMVDRLADEEAARSLRRAGRPATRPDNPWE